MTVQQLVLSESRSRWTSALVAVLVDAFVPVVRYVVSYPGCGCSQGERERLRTCSSSQSFLTRSTACRFKVMRICASSSSEYLQFLCTGRGV